MRVVRRATIALLLCVALAVAGAAVLSFSKDWIVGLGVRLGIDQYNARLNSRLSIQDVAFDLFSLTATVRGITIAERGQPPRGAPIYISQVQAKVQLWPLLQRRIVIEQVSASEANLRLEVNRQNGVNLAELFRLLADERPDMPSAWNVIVRRFVVEHVAVNLSLAGQPLHTTLQNMAFEGSMTLAPLRLRTEMLGGQGEVSYRLGSEGGHYRLLQTSAGVALVKGRLTVEPLRVETPEFTLSGRGDLVQGQLAAQFNSDVMLSSLSSLMPAVPTPAGTLAVRGALAGQLDAPHLVVTAESHRLAVGPYAVSDLSASAQVTRGQVHIDRFTLGLAAGTVQGSGQLELVPPQLDMQVELADLSLAALLSLVGRPFPALGGHLGGQLHVETASFDLNDMQATGHVVLTPPAPSPDFGPAPAPLPLPLGLAADVRLADRQITFKQTAWAMAGLKGEMSGTQSLDGTAHLRGTLDAHLAAPIFGQLGLQGMQGAVQVTFGVQGRLSAPRVTTEMQLHQARYRGFPVEHLQLAVEAEGAEIKILALVGRHREARYQLRGAIRLAVPFSELHQTLVTFPIQAIPELQLHVDHADLATLAGLLPMPVPLAGGSLGVSGEIRLRGFQLREMSLTAQLNQVRLRYPAGFFARLDAEIVISGDSTQQLLAGEASLSRARYRQDFDLASLLRHWRQRALEPPPMAQDRLQLDVRVAARDPVRIENRLAKLQLLPDLHIRGSVHRPIVLGRMEIAKGTADVAGTRFSAISGSIDFLNPTRTEPFFDIAADTRKSGYRIHVVATGTPQHIDLHLTSEPPLAEPDILALLTVGATGQAVTPGLTTVLPGPVSAFLTGRLAEEIGRGVGGLVGVDRLAIEPLVGGAQRVGGPKVTVGKDVSKDLSVTYSTIVGSTQEDTVTMEYRLTDSISILGIRDERGDIGVDVTYSIRFE